MMAAIRATTSSTMMLARLIFRPPLHSQVSVRLFRDTPPVGGFSRVRWLAPTRYCAVRCDSTKSGGQEKKSPARLAEVQRLLYEAEERYKAAGGGAEPIPQVTLDHVTVSYARSSGPGGQNVNKVNTKVDMRFNVKNAHWLSERVRERIMQLVTSENKMFLPVLSRKYSVFKHKEKNRINKDGEIVISSTRTRTQKGNIEDALAKLQAIIDAASYVPPPPSEETVKRIARLSSAAEQKRLDKKKSHSQKKAFRRSRDGWD